MSSPHAAKSRLNRSRRSGEAASQVFGLISPDSSLITTRYPSSPSLVFCSRIGSPGGTPGFIATAMPERACCLARKSFPARVSSEIHPSMMPASRRVTPASRAIAQRTIGRAIPDRVIRSFLEQGRLLIGPVKGSVRGRAKHPPRGLRPPREPQEAAREAGRKR